MNIVTFIQFAGGLGLFIYGMMTMGNALEKLAGERLEKTLEKMTGHIFKAILIGALVTGVIQSSSATTVMVVGFVNAGIMNLTQAVGIIMGANIGTTATAQLLRLDTSGALQGGVLLQVLKPSTLCYVLVVCGAVLIMLSKKKKRRDLGEALLGLGVLFVGMTIMESSVAALRDLPAFATLFATLSNPVLGILAGAVVTAVIQSSSASVGILQAISATGVLKYSAAVPIILGQNIGTCVTAIISSLGANRNAKRAAMIHLYFNLIGSIVFIIGIYIIKSLVGFSFWDMPIDKGGIANFHLLFNIVSTVCFIPFRRFLVWSAERTIKMRQVETPNELALLDTRFYASPAVALEQCAKVIASMSQSAYVNVEMASAALVEGTKPDTEVFLANEEYVDLCEARLNNYMLGINENELSGHGKRVYAKIFHAVGDYERIGDYAENLYEQHGSMTERGVVFSDTAIGELRQMRDAVLEIMMLTNQSLAATSAEAIARIEALEDTVDAMRETLKSRHIARLQNGMCTVNVGIHFLDIIHNYEKIADHCSNIAVYVLMYQHNDADVDVHAYRRELAAQMAGEFRQWQESYNDKYIKSIT